jgi:outer membrane protein OmpA-like peptidoglycan-associated protein
VVVGAALAWRFLTPEGSMATPGSLTGIASTEDLPAAKAERMKIAGIGGYSLQTVDLGDGPVPLLRIPLDEWGGYAALFAANAGAKPNRDSVFYKRFKFAVELVAVSDSQEQLDGFAAGRFPAIWQGMDGMPLLYDALHRDKRVSPRVIGLFDWSVGGDGILVRDYVRKPADLKGKTILTSYPAPFPFFLLWYLAQLDINPLEVKIVHVPDGDKALELFAKNTGIAAWVTWTPYLTDAVDPNSPGFVRGTRLLITSKDANQLVADVLVARSDFARERPEIARGLIEGMFEGVDIIAGRAGPAARDATFQAMASFYGHSGGASEAKSMLDEVHLATATESRMFFDPENPLGANKIFLLALEYYKTLGALPSSASYEPDRAIDTGPLQAALATGRFDSQPNTIQTSFNRDAGLNIDDLEGQRLVLASDLKLYFEAQKLEFDPDAGTEETRQNMRALARIAEQMKILGTTMVKLVGHLDTSKVAEFKAKGAKDFVEASAQAKFISKRRAEFVKKLLVERFGVDAERIVTEGRGWDDPVDESNPEANRRVEVQFISFE